MNALLLATALMAMSAPQKAAVQVNVNAKSGEAITGERTFRVTVLAKNPVTSVEFYAGSELRDKDTSTPYEFTVDSLAETEGNLKLRFKAFTTEGESGEAAITVKVDNGIAKGLDFHLQKGNDALAESKWDQAVTAGRIAIKIDPKSVPARLVTARGYLGKNAYDKAQKYAEDAVEADPSNAAARDLLASVKLRTAFAVVTRGSGDRAESLASIREAYKGAIQNRRASVDAALEKMGAPTDENRIAYADAAIRAFRYSAAISALQSAFEKDNRSVPVGNRLAYAQLRTGRLNDALATLQQLKKFGQPDAYSYALMAVLYAELGDAARSDEAIKEAVLQEADNAAVLSAQAHIALKYVRSKAADRTTFLLNYDNLSGNDAAARDEARKTLKSVVDQLQREQGQRPEVSYYLSALNNKMDEFGPAQSAFERAVLAEPLTVDAYIEQGHRSLGLVYRGNPTKEEVQQRLDVARLNFESALEARPDSAEALTGLTLAAVAGGKLDDAIKWGTAAVRANPNYAAGHVALGTAYTLAATGKRSEADRARKASTAGGNTNSDRQANELKARQLEAEASTYARQGREAGDLAAKLDPRAQGLELTRPNAAWRYAVAGGRTPVIPAPK